MASHLASRPFPLLPASSPQCVLLVEENSSDLRTLRSLISGITPHVDLTHAVRLVDAVERLREQRFDAVLLSLPAGESGTVKRVIECTDAPIIVLTTSANDPVGLQALQDGADSYLNKQSLDCDTLRHVLRCAIARNIWRSQLYALSLIDDLTGLYNRRGFMTLGEQQLTIARRAGAGVNLVFADLDALKFINDHFGHSEGDRALQDAARILKAAFYRESDLVARIGGDEFAVLWIARMPFSTDTVRGRLKGAFDSYAASQKLPYRLSLSIGLCQYDPDFSRPLAEMLSEGDQRMYEEKCRSGKANIA